jgi:ADP-dependent NAD(P)H-hydrate dehydratase / NAD(P)H-hydrate epimerase
LSNMAIQKNRIEVARKFAEQTGATVVLKGANTVVALANGDTYLNPTGNPSMATAGMGDVLSGVIGGYLAQGLSLAQAAIAGAYHHGLAGDRVAVKKGMRGLLASDVIDEFPRLSLDAG